MKFSQRKADKIVAAVLGGATVKQLGETKGFPKATVLFAWLAQNPEFAEDYSRAKLLQLANRLDEVIDIADDADLDPEVARRMIDARKWLVGRLLPPTFRHPYMLESVPRTSSEDLARMIESKPAEAADEAGEPEVQVIEPDEALDREINAWRKGRNGV